ncbi:hypothetical protein CJF32_00001691 [Rutstroemia sp. NJR-2017a WRK4]|nr:hypothetical protein CJF32_00001691 [Rutstroemia sp. NJR-2017a WRK4]
MALEVIGGIASIAQLAGTVYTLSKTLYEVSESLSNASAEITDLARDLETFAEELNLLSTLLHGKDGRYADRIYRLTAKIIGDCATICLKIDRIIRKCRRDSVWGKVKWLYKEKEILKLLARLRDLKLSLMSTLSVLSALRADYMMDSLGIQHASLLGGPKDQGISDETMKEVEETKTKLASISLNNNPNICTYKPTTRANPSKPSPHAGGSGLTLTSSSTLTSSTITPTSSSSIARGTMGDLGTGVPPFISNVLMPGSIPMQNLRALESVDSFHSAISHLDDDDGGSSALAGEARGAAPASSLTAVAHSQGASSSNHSTQPIRASSQSPHLSPPAIPKPPPIPLSYYPSHYQRSHTQPRTYHPILPWPPDRTVTTTTGPSSTSSLSTTVAPTQTDTSDDPWSPHNPQDLASRQRRISQNTLVVAVGGWGYIAKAERELDEMFTTGKKRRTAGDKALPSDEEDEESRTQNLPDPVPSLPIFLQAQNVAVGDNDGSNDSIPKQQEALTVWREEMITSAIKNIGMAREDAIETTADSNIQTPQAAVCDPASHSNIVNSPHCSSKNIHFSGSCSLSVNSSSSPPPVTDSPPDSPWPDPESPQVAFARMSSNLLKAQFSGSATVPKHGYQQFQQPTQQRLLQPPQQQQQFPPSAQSRSYGSLSYGPAISESTMMQTMAPLGPNSRTSEAWKTPDSTNIPLSHLRDSSSNALNMDSEELQAFRKIRPPMSVVHAESSPASNSVGELWLKALRTLELDGNGAAKFLKACLDTNGVCYGDSYRTNPPHKIEPWAADAYEQRLTMLCDRLPGAETPIQQIFRILNVMKQTLGFESGIIVWPCLTTAAEHMLLPIRAFSGQEKLDNLACLAEIATIVARYTVMESIYSNWKGMSLEKEYESALIQLSTHVLRYIGLMLKFSLRREGGSDMKGYFGKIRRADAKCRGFSAVISTDDRHDRREVEVEDVSDDSDSTLDIADNERYCKRKREVESEGDRKRQKILDAQSYQKLLAKECYGMEC